MMKIWKTIFYLSNSRLNQEKRFPIVSPRKLSTHPCHSYSYRCQEFDFRRSVPIGKPWRRLQPLYNASRCPQYTPEHRKNRCFGAWNPDLVPSCLSFVFSNHTHGEFNIDIIRNGGFMTEDFLVFRRNSSCWEIGCCLFFVLWVVSKLVHCIELNSSFWKD